MLRRAVEPYIEDAWKPQDGEAEIQLFRAENGRLIVSLTSPPESDDISDVRGSNYIEIYTEKGKVSCPTCHGCL